MEDPLNTDEPPKNDNMQVKTKIDADLHMSNNFMKTQLNKNPTGHSNYPKYIDQFLKFIKPPKNNMKVKMKIDAGSHMSNNFMNIHLNNNPTGHSGYPKNIDQFIEIEDPLNIEPPKYDMQVKTEIDADLHMSNNFMNTNLDNNPTGRSDYPKNIDQFIKVEGPHKNEPPKNDMQVKTEIDADLHMSNNFMNTNLDNNPRGHSDYPKNIDQFIKMEDPFNIEPPKYDMQVKTEMDADLHMSNNFMNTNLDNNPTGHSDYPRNIDQFIKMEGPHKNEPPKNVMQVKTENDADLHMSNNFMNTHLDINQTGHSDDVIMCNPVSTNEKPHILENDKQMEVAVPNGNGIELFSIVEIEDTSIKTQITKKQVLKKFKCPVCKKAFSSRCHVEIHMRVHTGEKPFKCTLCGKSYRHKSSIKYHSLNHTRIKTYKCGQCDRAFVTEQYLREHTEYVHPAFKCALCGNRFREKKFLKAHLLIHTKIRPYKCGQCDRVFVTQKDLGAHTLIHSKEQPFTCDLCNKSFVCEKNLKHHQAGTIGLSFRCDVCEMKFCHQNLLRRHKLEVHIGQKHESVVHMQTHPENVENQNPSLKKNLEINSIPAEGETIEGKEKQAKTMAANPSNEIKVEDENSSDAFELNSEVKPNTNFNYFEDIKIKQEPFEQNVKKFS